MAGNRNEGIVQSGGSIEAGALAVGRGSRAVHAGDRGREAVGAAIDRLDETIRRAQLDGAELDSLRASIEELRAQLAAPKPKRILLESLLTSIEAAAGAVGGVARRDARTRALPRGDVLSLPMPHRRHGRA